MNCPKCDAQTLVPGTHGVSRCPSCHGLFVPRTQLHAVLEDEEDAPAGAADPKLDEKGALCPQDHSIMARARISVGESDAFHLERCASCKGVWFDAGEWGKLASQHLLSQFDEFWSVEYRRKERLADDRAVYENRMKKTFGAELFYQLRSVATALRNHPRRSQALAFIREESDDA